MKNPKKNATTKMARRQRSTLPARVCIFIFIFVAIVVMGLRVKEIAGDLAAGNVPQVITPAHAETAAKEADKPAPAETKKEETKKEEAPKPEAQKPDAAKAEIPKEDAPKEDNSGDTADSSNGSEPENYSEAEVNILKKLSERRKELEKRAREMDEREALLKVTEQRVDKKMDDLKATQEQLRQAIGDATAEQKAKADSLVKIYESMKPKEAARIFDALDMQTLLTVISRMKEARIAPILAAMDANKAKQVTAALIEKKPLPAMPQ